MHPVMGQWGDFKIYSYGVANLASAFLFAVLMALLLRARGRNAAPAIDLTLWMIAGYSLLARLIVVLLSSDWEFFTRFSLEKLDTGYWGGQVGFGLLAIGYLLVSRESFAPLADALAATWAGATVLHKLGCFLGGCCGGSPSSVPWAMTFPSAGLSANPGVAVHPTQLYDVFAALLLTAILLVMFMRRRAEGRLLLWWGLGYALAKLASEWFRGDSRFVVAGPVTASMIVEIAVAAACAFLLVRPEPYLRLVEWRDRRAAGWMDPIGNVGKAASFFLGLAGFVAASIVSGLSRLVLTWPGAPIAVYFGLYSMWELLGVRGLLGLRITDRNGVPPSTRRLFVRAIAAAAAPLTFFGLFRPLFDRWGRSLGDAAAGTWVLRSLPRPFPEVAR
jgi:phosphatidylglycerol:prolipoprotein diacylglycerol transferase